MAEVCGCILDGVVLIGHIREARRALRFNPARTVLYAAFAVEDVPKMEKCVGAPLPQVKEPLEKIGPVLEERKTEEASRLLDLAETRLMRKIRQCRGEL